MSFAKGPHNSFPRLGVLRGEGPEALEPELPGSQRCEPGCPSCIEVFRDEFASRPRRHHTASFEPTTLGASLGVAKGVPSPKPDAICSSSLAPRLLTGGRLAQLVHAVFEPGHQFQRVKGKQQY